MNLITLLQYNFYSYELRLFLKAGANIQPLFNSTKLFWKKIDVTIAGFVLSALFLFLALKDADEDSAI